MNKDVFRMKTKKIFTIGLLFAITVPALAGGILTNTNQSIAFLRNPARDAAIGIDGVYSNPAGVAFLPEGFHLGLNWQYAHQTRTITNINPLLALGAKNGGSMIKTYEGVADAPFIPSIQAAYNKNNWSLQFNFSVPGGGGKCKFENGLGSFESVVGGIAHRLGAFGATGYDMDGFMEGRQYYFGFQLGAAYKIHKNLSIYGGLRVLYGTATYKAKISNILVKTDNGNYTFGEYLDIITPIAESGLQQVQAGIAQYKAAGIDIPQELLIKEAQLQSIPQLQKYRSGVNLLCNQTSVGVAPVLGIDYKIGHFNFSAKYEFKTQIRMKNESTVNEASEISAVNKFRDGEDIDEDSPAQLAVGAQWEIIPSLRINAGYHHFFDTNVSWYGNAQEKLSGGTNEYLGGAEWDINDKLQVSAGFQITRYGLTDDYMNDMSFVVNSWSFGFGVGYNVSDKVKINAAYFQTDYGTYDRINMPTSTTAFSAESFTRTNRVFGLGVELHL